MAIDEGFLCSASIKKLLDYVPEEDYTGFMLADRLTAAGIRIDKETFVALFEKLQQKIAKKQKNRKSFTTKIIKIQGKN